MRGWHGLRGLFSIVAVAAVAAVAPASGSALELRRGDVLAASQEPSKIEVYSQSGLPIGEFGEGLHGTNMCVSPDGLYVVAPGAGVYDTSGHPLISQWASSGAGGKCAIDDHDDVYVAGGPSTDEQPDNVTGTFRKFDIYGNLLQTYTVKAHYTYGPGIESLDIGPDQCTVYYNGSGDLVIERYDVCTETQLTPLYARGLSDALKVRANGNLVIGEDYGADEFEPAPGEASMKVVEGWAPLGGSGNGYYSLVALNPDERSVWVGALRPTLKWGLNDACANTYEFELQNPQSPAWGGLLTYLHQPEPCGQGEITGLAVYGSAGPIGSPEGAPGAQASQATEVGQSSALLHGTVNPNGKTVTRCEFTVAGHGVPCSSSPGSGSEPVEVSAATGNWLWPGTQYRVLLDAESEAGDGLSYDQDSSTTFTTEKEHEPPPDGPNLPEFGHCVHVEGHTGSYWRPDCTRTGHSSRKSEGAYEWVPWKTGEYSFASTRLVAARLRGVVAGTKHGFSCKSGAITGALTGPKALSARIVLHECSSHTDSSEECSSEGAEPGTITSDLLRGELGFVSQGAHPRLGLQIGPANGDALLAFDCGEGQEIMKGAVLAAVTPADKMTSAMALKLAAPFRMRKPIALEGRAPVEPVVVDPEGSQGANLTMRATLAAEEGFEAKALP